MKNPATMSCSNYRFLRDQRRPTLLKLLKRTLSIYLFGFTFLISTAGYAQRMPNGDGTGASPYQITSLENLQWLSMSANSSYWDKTYSLMNDIDASSTKNTVFTPIGNSTTPFTGIFHGNGHKISHLKINATTTNYVGLFGVAKARIQTTEADCSCLIDNLGIDSSDIYGASYTGALAGAVYGICINNCYVTNSIVQSTSHYVGGMIGLFDVVPYRDASHVQIISYMSSCFTAGCQVKSTGSYVGGLIGCTSNCTIYASYSRDSVSAAAYAGGLIGVITGGAKPGACYSTGVVKGTSYSGLLYGSGPAGNQSATTENCFWDTQSSNGSTVQVTNVGSGKTSAEMKLQSTFTNWNFESMWAIGSGTNDGYPFLRFIAVPEIATMAINGVIDSTRQMSSIVATGKLKSMSMSKPTAYGFCYGTSPNPTIAGSKISLGTISNPGNFSGTITGLTGSDTSLYYVRAYITNPSGTYYGEQKAFYRGVVSYHWQLSEGNQPVNALSRATDTTFLATLNTGSAKIADTASLWLDSAADGKRYVHNLNDFGDISYGYKYNKDLGWANHTYYITAKNTVPALGVVVQRTANTYCKVNFKFSHDTIYSSIFDRDSWKPTFVSLQKAKGTGDWLPFFVHIKNLSNDSTQVTFGCADQAYASVTVADSQGGTWRTGSSYCWVVGDSARALVSDVHVFSSYDSMGVANIWRAFFSPSYLDNGPLIRVPVHVHNIIYDPPGSESYSTCSFDTTLTTRWNFNWGTHAGGSLQVGLNANISVGFSFIGNATTTLSCQQTVTGEVHYAYDHNWGGETSLSRSTSTSSMVDNDDSTFIGPTLGDVVVYQSIAYRTSMMRRPFMNKFRTAKEESDFVHASAGALLVPDSSGVVYYKPIRTLVAELGNDTAALSALQLEYPFDLKTGRVLASALDSAVGVVNKAKNPPRLQKYEPEKVIGGNITYSHSTTREDVVGSDTTHSWGGSVTYTEAVWAGLGYQLDIYGGCDFAHYRSASDGAGSTVAYTFQDNDSWDVFRITPYKDMYLKTICFLIDSANSYSSFPHEANTKAAVSWQISSMPACTGYVGQATEIKMKVKNTSPKSILSNLPSAFTFSVNAINFPGTYTVYPENAEIAVGNEVEFTIALYGANADSFMQQIKVTCWAKDNFRYMEETVQFPMVIRTADVGLVAVIPADTVFVKKGEALSNAFKIKLVNTGNLAATVISGEAETSTGATATYSTITNPVNPGDTTLLTITLTGDGTQNTYSTTFWTQIQDAPVTKSLHTVVIVVRDPVGVKKLSSGKIYQLGLRGFGGGRVAVMVPENEHPKLRIFAINGKAVFTASFNPGQTMLDMSTLSLPVGYYVLQLQGRKQDIRQRFIVSKK